jgi:hypothetical protein
VLIKETHTPKLHSSDTPGNASVTTTK